MWIVMKGCKCRSIFWIYGDIFWSVLDLLKMGLFFYYFQSDGNTSFLRAARDGNLQEVLEYLTGSTDINTSNPVSNRP